ncbi:pentapeptide repeat-containing protein [Micromonospora arborensis]|uniref:pentapeptide repeat-containing protein n=1 Tax=Micromonospora arborensis TaxID=2116518 RepID=UPI003719CA52
MAAVGALVVSTISIYYTGNQARLQEQGQVTDRYTKAVEQLGSSQVSVRLGAIYSLERLMRDSPDDQSTIVKVLSGFVRERAVDNHPGYDREREIWPPLDQPRAEAESRPATDVQTAVTVIGRSNLGSHQGPIIDFSGADLSNVDLSSGNYEYGNFEETALIGAKLSRANLRGITATAADLSRTEGHDVNFQGATLNRARLDEALLYPVDFRAANLNRVQAVRATLGFARMEDAHLNRATFVNTVLVYPDFFNASGSEIDLRGTTLETSRNLPRLRCPITDAATKLPVDTTVVHDSCTAETPRPVQTGSR